jgi:signal transduction histidine kinase
MPFPHWSQRPAAQDTVLAAAVAVACLLLSAPGAIIKSAVVGLRSDWWADLQGPFWWLAAVLAGCAIALRRRWPLLMLALSVLAVAVTVGTAVPVLYTDVSVLILLYTVAVRHERGVSLAALAALSVLAAVWCLYSVVSSGPAPSRPDASAIASALPGSQRHSVAVRGGEGVWIPAATRLFLIGSGLLAAWAIGAGARNRRAYLDQLRARAQDLERDRHRQAELTVAAERARISRELHDVVAHGLSVIVVQAQGGAAALPVRPGDTQTALEAIVRTGRESLTELRRVLAGVGVDDAWYPRPGLAQLYDLLDQVRCAGTPVGLRITGIPAPLPSTVDLAAYRIVQEALTNTMKHGGKGATAEVTLAYLPTLLDIDVTDTGCGPRRPDDGDGNGLRGMAERVRLLGGNLATGPAPDGGFRVHAALPTKDGHP